MKLEFLTHTPHIEALIAASMLTTTTGDKPSKIFIRLKARPEQVSKILNRLETQHGSILEHNRVVWFLEASEREVLDLLLSSKFLNITELGEERWLISANVRTVVELLSTESGPFCNELACTLEKISPTLYKGISKGSR